MTAIQLFGVLLLIGINGFFSATEFSLVAVRLSRVRQLIEKGDPRAKIVEGLLGDLGRVVSGVQVGITLTSLSLGYIGEITLARILSPLAEAVSGRWAAMVAHSISLIVAFGLLTVLQVVLGELVPKSVSLASAERVALLVARPFHWFLNTFRWAIDSLDGIADRISRSLGVVTPHSHTLVRSAEELQIMVQQAHDRGLIPDAELKLIQSAMELGQVQVREVMVPRPDVHALAANASLEDAMTMFATTQRSRIPVFEGTLDHILGFVHIKDMIWVLLDRARRAEDRLQPAEFQLRRLLRDALIVPESKPVSELLIEFRSRRTGLAMVVDEFGSILGLATLEDILEQMVGEIHDEFDVVERPLVLPDGGMIFDAAITVRDLAAKHGIDLTGDPSYETVAGFILNRLGFVPRGGESFEAEGYRFTVMEMEKRRVSRVKIKPLPVPAPVPPESEAPKSAPEAAVVPSNGGAEAATVAVAPTKRKRSRKSSAKVQEPQ